MITPTQQIVCSIVSRQLIADLSPTSRQPVADQSQPISNQLAINCPPVADWSPIFRDSCRRSVADWSATEKYSFWSHSGCIGCSWFLVARQSPTGCSTCVRGLSHDLGQDSRRIHYYNMVRWISAPSTMHFCPQYDTFWPCGLFTLLQFCKHPPSKITMKLRWVSSVN